MASRNPRNLKTVVIVIASLLILLGGVSPSNGESPPSGIHVELDPQKPLWLHVTLMSRSESRVTVYRSSLPWGNRYSMILVAVLPSGKSLKKELIVDDPTLEQIALDPNKSISGDINLQNVFRDLNASVTMSDVQLFWAYQAPEELGIPRWSGGWILIPQQK